MRLKLFSYVAAAWFICLVFSAFGWSAEQSGESAAAEPDYRTAAQWWSELPKKWTPVGWKNHMFRYNVLFNGAIVAQPDLYRRTQKWCSQGVLLWPSPANPKDDGSILQGWRTDCEAPVLWTDWSGSSYEGAKDSGLTLRQEIFAHIPGADDVVTGIEPLFAWTRISIPPQESKPGDSSKYVLSYYVFSPTRDTKIAYEGNLKYRWATYPRDLLFRPATPDNPYALLLERDGNVRLAVAAQEGCKVRFRAIQREEFAFAPALLALEVKFDLRKPNRLDLLVPIIPAPQETAKAECQLGYDKSLAEANAYWQRKPQTAATVDVPEEEVNRTIKRLLQMAEVIADKNPTTGDYCALSGSWTYAVAWATPNSMLMGLFLDPMGYHDQAERYLTPFLKHQGSIVPPGEVYKAHPGYLGTPKAYTSVNWLSDNGALLWTISQHALFTGDKKYIEKYTPAIIKSCEWIRDARRISEHGGFAGILPAGRSTDRPDQMQSTWNDGWNYKGLATAVRLLKRIEHPRAKEFEDEARDYREKFRLALAEVAKRTPTWTDEAGKVHHMAPWYLPTKGDNFGIDHGFYLDGGPLFLVFSGLMDAEDDLIRSNRQWFRNGPGREVYQDLHCRTVPPCLHHEMSSCEPGCSWVYFHSWQQADRPKFLEGMYSMYTGACSRQTYTVCETRGGITGLIPAFPIFWLSRLAVIDEQIAEGELHLLRLAPLAWLLAERPLRFENMPTELGVVSLTAKLSPDKRELQVKFDPSFRIKPKRIVLHVPPVKGLKAVRLNGRPLAWDGNSTVIDIEGGETSH